ncbi:MAG: hypothetical protein WCN98_10945 [Verrucomicrobiaceae bacterium]
MSEKILLKSGATSKKSSPPLGCDKAGALEDPAAFAHEAKVHMELNAQFRELKRQAQGVFEAVKGRIGAHQEEQLEQVFAKAREDYGSGHFLIQRLGADRQLDMPLVATLTQLRHGLLGGVDHLTAADHMLADSAIIAYRNMLRVQGWLGNMCLAVERELFGQFASSDFDAREVIAMMERIEEKLLPMLERSQRMLCRALDGIETRRRSKSGTSVSIGVAGQVNVS